jgi:hypothetical protein
MSLPIKGERGVYVAQVDAVQDPMEVESYDSEVSSVSARLSARANSGVFNALKEKAEVKDERAKFY